METISDVEGKILTKREREVFDFIRVFWMKYGVSPSYREIGTAVELRSSSSVHRYIVALSKKGMLYFPSGKTRCLILQSLHDSLDISI